MFLWPCNASGQTAPPLHCSIIGRRRPPQGPVFAATCESPFRPRGSGPLFAGPGPTMHIDDVVTLRFPFRALTARAAGSRIHPGPPPAGGPLCLTHYTVCTAPTLWASFQTQRAQSASDAFFKGRSLAASSTEQFWKVRQGKADYKSKKKGPKL